MMQTVLFVDDEEGLRIARSQSSEGIVVTDIQIPGNDGLWLMRQALEIDPEFPVILVYGRNTPTEVVHLLG